MAIFERSVTRGTRSYSTSGPLAVNLPTDWSAQDVAVLYVTYRTLNSNPDDFSLTTHPDWTLVNSDITASAFDNKGIYVYVRPLESGDASWEFSVTGQANIGWILKVYGGVDRTTPVPSSALQKSTSNTTTHTTPGITIATANSWLLCFWTDRTSDINPTPGDPAGMTLEDEVYKSLSWPTIGAASGMVWHELRSGTGATGTRTFESTSGDSDYCSISFELMVGATAQDLNEGSQGSISFRSGVHRIETDTTLSGAEAELGKELANLTLLAELEPYDPSTGNTAPKYLSADDFRSASSDTPASEEFQRVLGGGLRLSRSILSGDLIGGQATLNIGSIALANERQDDEGPGDLDSWVYDLIWDDRPATIKLAGRTSAGVELTLAQAFTLLSCRTAALEVSGPESMRLVLVDAAHRLGRKAQMVKFAGTGGLEGPEELKGKPCPMILGEVYGFAPPMLDRSDRTYLLHRDSAGGQAQTPTAVRIGGNLISSEDWEYDTATSVLTPLVALDENKTLTVDCAGPTAAGTTLESMVTYLVSTIGVLTAAELDASIALLDAHYPGSAGWVIEGEDSIADVLNAWLYPFAWWGFTREGKLKVAPIQDPAEAFVDQTLPAAAIRNVTPRTSPPPVRSLSVLYRRNWNKVSEDGVTGAALATEYGQWMLQDGYTLNIENDDLAQVWASARTPDQIQLPFNEQADALRILKHLWGLYSRPWRVYDIDAKDIALRFQEGETVTVTWDRWELAGGVPLLLLTLDLQGTLDPRLTFWRPAPVSALATDTLDWIVTGAGEKIEVT